MMWNLLETASGYWIDVEGTRYHYDDVYGDIIEKELEKKRREGDAYKPLWKIHVRGAFKKVVPHDCGYTEQQFTPDELRWSRLTEDGHFVSHFPEKINHDGLEMLRITDEKTFASQQLNDPSDMSDTGMIPFPMKYFRTISREDFKANVKIMMYTAAVDTAETQSERSDYSAVTVVGWSAGGVGYVVDIRHGRWLPDTLVDQVFDVQRVWRPLSFKIEDVSYNRGLMPTFNRRMQTPQGGRSDPDPFINFELIKRETTVTKIERIQNTLQPFYKAGQIVFLEDLDKIEEVKKEFLQFKSTVHEDIIDTLSDHFQNREWFGRLAPREIQERDIQQAFTEALEITSPFSPQFHRGVPEPFPSHYNVTGGL
jgi:predicted phage terminase large subunit-like protein